MPEVMGDNDMMLDQSLHVQFFESRGYLNTASMGLGPRSAIEAVQTALANWGSGSSDPSDFDVDIERARRAYARIAGADSDSVAIVSQVSVASGFVASSLPDGAIVLCAEEDFASLLFPFLADGRLDVRFVPLAELLDHIDPSVDLVAVSAVQSADGRVIDLSRLAEISTENGTRTYLDVSQAAGWLPIDAHRFDVTAGGAYKWLLSPRGSGFITIGSDADWLKPIYAGWYSGPDPWSSLYGPPLRLAEDARRFDVSPAWFDFVGAARSVELLADIGVEAINEHSVGLANRLRERMGLEPSNSAIVSLDTRRGDALAAAGIKASARAGRVRLSFYVYNTVDDVDRAADALLGE
jgi:selenocysteine lyase/cysteine desulfurase